MGPDMAVYTALPSHWTCADTIKTGEENSKVRELSGFTVPPQTVNFPTGVWNSYAITIDQTTYTRNVFVNGVLIDECTGTGGLGFSPDMIAIGRGGDGGLYGATARASTGYVREFAVFDAVLTQAEVDAYHTESAPVDSTPWLGILVIVLIIVAVICLGVCVVAVCCK